MTVFHEYLPNFIGKLRVEEERQEVGRMGEGVVKRYKRPVINKSWDVMYSIVPIVNNTALYI